MKPWMLLLALLLAACQAAPTPAAGTPSAPASPPPASLRRLPTQTRTATLTATTAATRTPLPTLTPTPRSHTVAKGEDLTLIAIRYKVTVEAILAANPGINPRALPVGLVLVIPPSTATQTAAPPSATPAPLATGTLRCYPQADGGVRCFLPVRNPNTFALESISAAIHLEDLRSRALLTQTGTAPLNLLPPGAELSLAAYFPPPVPSAFSAFADSVRALPVLSKETRYLPARLEKLKSQLAADGLSAVLNGEVQLENEKVEAKTVWVAAVAYDASGAVVGVRRWESATPLPAGKALTFEVSVYAAGGKIARVEAVVEAR